MSSWPSARTHLEPLKPQGTRNRPAWVAYPDSTADDARSSLETRGLRLSRTAARTRDPPDRRIDQLDRVHHRATASPAPRPLTCNLQRAAGIGGGDDVGLDRGDVVRPSARRAAARGVRLHQVVDPGAAAAQLRLRERHQLDAGNLLQQIARLLRGCPARARGDRRRDRRRADASGCRVARGWPSSTSSSVTSRTRAVNAARARRPRGIVGEQALVLLHRRPAPGGVDDDRARRRPCSKASMVRRANARASSAAAGVQRERAAAALRRRRHDLAALGRQHADGRVVDVREDEPLHAAGQQADRHAGAGRRRACARARRASAIDSDDRRRQLGQRAQPRGQQVQQPAALRAAAESSGRPAAAPARAAAARDTAPPRTAPSGTADRRRRVVAALDLRARGLDQRRVLHAGRAGGDAGHAAEAGVEVADERRRSCRRGLRGRTSSGRSARAASPSPRPTARRSDTSADRSRSARTCRSARARADGGRRTRGSRPVRPIGSQRTSPRARACRADRAARLTRGDQRHGSAAGPTRSSATSARRRRAEHDDVAERRPTRAAASTARPGDPRRRRRCGSCPRRRPARPISSSAPRPLASISVGQRASA